MRPGEGRGPVRAGPGRRLGWWPAVLLLGTAAAGCRGRSEGDERAWRELADLERTLADLADTERNPALTDAALEVLRGFAARDGRVEAARRACLRQYETMRQAQVDLETCSGLEARLRESVRTADPGSLDAAPLLAEAQRVCSRAFEATDRVERYRAACDEAMDRVRRALGRTGAGR